jgi:hypothetical protein
LKPPGFSFSLSRATGLTAAKRKFAKGTEVPLSRPGRQRKIGAAVGCAVALIPIAGLIGLTFKLIEVAT